MDKPTALDDFILEWACYLHQKRHRVSVEAVSPPVLTSEAESGRYRWLLMHAQGPVRRLTAIEHEHMVREHQKAEATGKQAFLVMKFEDPLSKLVVLPLDSAVKLSFVRADKGGISWDL